MGNASNTPLESIAIIGLGAIVPGSTTVSELFRNFLNKRCFIRDLPEGLWEREVFFSEDRDAAVRTYSALGALLGDVDLDMSGLRIPPTVARRMGRSQKLALLCARQALGDAGFLDGASGRGFDRERTGVIMAAVPGGDAADANQGAIHAERFRAQLRSLARDGAEAAALEALLARHAEHFPQVPITEDTLPGESAGITAGRIASTFDLHGPNLSIESACASTLAAVGVAIDALRSGQCDTVIAGGVETAIGAEAFVKFSKIQALSSTGSYVFDQRADGFVIGEGCGVFVLRREVDAVRDGQRIYATVRGYGASSDGAGKGISAPDASGQRRALERAYAQAGVAPQALHFVECHGTGTRVGDATELESLGTWWRSQGPRDRSLPIGSCKSVVGHLRVAAGAAGLLRAIAAINGRMVPPQVHCEHPTDAVDWGRYGLRIPSSAEAIDDPMVTAGVSAFGFGGTNYHVVLQSPSQSARPPVVDRRNHLVSPIPGVGGDLALLFPGQGSQRLGALVPLRDDPAAMDLLDRAEAVVQDETGSGIASLLTLDPDALDPDARRHLELRLRATDLAQPAIFVTSVIFLHRLRLHRLRRAGLEPAMAIGHSLGEYTAAHASGMLSFEDALRCVAVRGRLMAQMDHAETGEFDPGFDPGTMAHVACDAHRAQALIDQGGWDNAVMCANLNAYDQTVVAGGTAEVEAFTALALEEGLDAGLLEVSRAFHCPALEPLLVPLRQTLESCTFRYPRIPVVANILGVPYPAAPDPTRIGQPMDTADRDRAMDLLGRNMIEPVDFVRQVELAFESGIRRFWDVGPRTVLSGLVDRILQGKAFQIVGLDGPQPPADQLGDLERLAKAPITPRRRPLVERYTGSEDAPEVDVSGLLATGSAADRVRAAVARVTGFEPSVIGDDTEFERELGIDTLKIVEIFALLRGVILPKDFMRLREATSVRKILRFALPEAARSPTARIKAAESGATGLRCLRFERVETDLPELPAGATGPATSYRIVGRRAVEPLGVDLGGLPDPTEDDGTEDDGARNILFLAPLPETPEALCADTVPGILEFCTDLDRDVDTDLEIAGGTPRTFHLVTLGAFSESAFRALCALAKSLQKDLAHVQVSYWHVDALRPDAEAWSRVLGEPVLGCRLKSDPLAHDRLAPSSLMHGRLSPRPLPAPATALPELLTEHDLVLVTGGGRGVAAHAVRALLPVLRCRFLLVGRNAHPAPWVADEGQGRVDYAAADLRDADAVARLEFHRRPVTLLVHAAGVEVSRRLREVTTDEVRRVMDTKVLGLGHVLEALDTRHLRGTVLFSSIAAAVGGFGQPDYAAANGFLDGFTLPGVPSLSIGWTAWADIGMAAREPTRSFLRALGVESLDPDVGADLLARLLAEWLAAPTDGSTHVVVHGAMPSSAFLSTDPTLQGTPEAMSAPAPTPEEPRRFRLSFSQERLWFLEHLPGIGSTHHLAFTERFEGPLDTVALRRALQLLVDRHDVLRTVFRTEGGPDGHAPIAVVLPSVDLRVSHVDLTSVPGTASERVEPAIRAAVDVPFDLASGPLVRATLHVLGPMDHVLLVVFHHLVMDGVSVWLFRRELLAVYRALTAGRTPGLAPTEPFAELAATERQRFGVEWQRRQLDHWRPRLDGIPRALDLPADRPRPKRYAFQAAAIPLRVPTPVAQALESLGRREGVSLFVTLLAAYQVLLMRLSGEEDVVVGSPFVGRTVEGSEEALGFFVNTLPLRGDLSGNPTFRGLTQRVRGVVFDAFAHQELPLQRLVEALALDRDPSTPPLFQVTFRLLHAQDGDMELEGVRRTFTDVHSGGSAHELGLMVRADGDVLEGRLEYVTSRFDRSTAQRIVDRYLHMLTVLGAPVAPSDDPWDQRLWTLPCITPAEHEQLLRMGEGARTPYPDLTVHGLFSEQARRRPDATALVAGDELLTYGALDQRAEALARRLAERGLGQGDVVAVCLPRGLRLVEALLGVMKVGAAYLPLDPKDPASRLRAQCAALGAAAVVLDEARAAMFDPDAGTPAGALPLIVLSRSTLARRTVGARSPRSAQPTATATATADLENTHLACVMTTSGSTGEPLGVEVTHRAIVRLLFGTECVRFGPHETFLHLAPTAFDASTFELWGPLLHGGCCVLFPGAVPRFDTLGECLRTHRVSTLWLTASLFNAILDDCPTILGGVRQVVTGGETLSPAHVSRARQLLPELQLVNGYGPTEATTFTACFPLPDGPWDPDTPVPIGSPLDNVRVHVLDRHLGPSPIGVDGELHIAGDGLARGYRGHNGRTRGAARATAARFVPDPFNEAPGARMYRTGDRARWRTDGNLDFLGRRDRQVKLRGFRVELAAVEAQLMRHRDVAQAAVVVRGDSLVAYYSVAEDGVVKGSVVKDGVAEDSAPTADILRADLLDTLPAHQVPTAYVELEALPLTDRGKLDHSALPDPADSAPAPPIERPWAPLRDEVESTLRQLFSTLLQRPRVGLHDDFFDLGGHSLLALRLLAGVRRITGHALPLDVLFARPTPALLAEAFLDGSWAPAERSVISLRSEASGPPIFAVCGVFGHAFRLLMLGRDLRSRPPFHALQPPGMAWPPELLGTGNGDGSHFEHMADAYVERVMALQPEGPIRLLGTSFGGVMVYEMACRLQRLGRTVDLLAVVDTMPPLEEDRREWDDLSRMLDGAFDLPNLDPIEREGLGVARVHLEALGAYRPSDRFRGSMTYFLHTEHGYPGPQDRRFAWGQYVTEGQRILPIGGAHGRFFENPARSEIRHHLDTLLAGAPTPALPAEAYRRHHLDYRRIEDSGGARLQVPEGQELAIRPDGDGTIQEIDQVRGRLWIRGTAPGATAVVVFGNARDTPLHVAIPDRGSGTFTCMVDLLHVDRLTARSLCILAVATTAGSEPADAWTLYTTPPEGIPWENHD